MQVIKNRIFFKFKSTRPESSKSCNAIFEFKSLNTSQLRTLHLMVKKLRQNEINFQFQVIEKKPN